MSTVERKGHPLAARETKKRIRPHGLQDAPTFRPTEEEFADPHRYIMKIANEGQKYGAVKIIPPDSWNPDFAVDTEVCSLVMGSSVRQASPRFVDATNDSRPESDMGIEVSFPHSASRAKLC